MSPSLAVGAGAAVGLYLVVLISVGYATRRRGAQTGLGDFYLAGRNLGGFVLLLTLYATQYSGNTLLGYPGEAFRIGYAWVMSVGFMMAIIVVYLIFAPRLQRLARRHAFVTPGDWITHRFRSAPLTLIANVLLVLAISNYLLAQLMAMGHVTEGLSGGAVPYWVGVVLLTLVVIVYETVGGMRAVAWTDCVQGIMLLVGLAGLLLAVVPTPTHLAELTMAVAGEAPEKVAVPALGGLAQLAQHPPAHRLLRCRVSARDPAHLRCPRRGHAQERLQCDGLPAAGHHRRHVHGGHSGHPRTVRHRRRRSGDAGAADRLERAVGAALPPLRDGHHRGRRRRDVDRRLGPPEPVVDTRQGHRREPTCSRHAPEERLTRIGKLLSWVVVAVLVLVALSPRVTLWGLTEIKMEILAQVAPLFVLGVTWRRLTTAAALGGMLAGCATYAGLLLAGRPQVWDVHAGVVGLGVNVAACVALTLLPARIAAPAAERTAGS